jgi:hypothetical protein
MAVRRWTLCGGAASGGRTVAGYEEADMSASEPQVAASALGLIHTSTEFARLGVLLAE